MRAIDIGGLRPEPIEEVVVTPFDLNDPAVKRAFEAGREQMREELLKMFGLNQPHPAVTPPVDYTPQPSGWGEYVYPNPVIGETTTVTDGNLTITFGSGSFWVLSNDDSNIITTGYAQATAAAGTDWNWSDLPQKGTITHAVIYDASGNTVDLQSLNKQVAKPIPIAKPIPTAALTVHAVT